MSGRKLTDWEFVEKADYEGGIAEAVLGYGLSADDLVDRDGPLALLLDEHSDTIRKFDDFTHAYAVLVDEIEPEYDDHNPDDE